MIFLLCIPKTAQVDQRARAAREVDPAAEALTSGGLSSTAAEHPGGEEVFRALVEASENIAGAQDENELPAPDYALLKRFNKVIEI